MLIHFLSSISPILIPPLCGFAWVLTNNFFWMYTAISTFFFGEYLNLLIKKRIAHYFSHFSFVLRPNPDAYCGFFFKPITQGTIAYGMPSGHCQTIGVFSALVICYLLRTQPKWWRTKIIGLIIASLYVGWSRWDLQCHTLFQIAYGLAVGYCLGIIAWKIKM